MSFNVLLVNAVLEENARLRGIVNANFQPSLQSRLNACPTDTSLWSQIPLLTGGTSFVVCDTTSGGFLVAGACCAWTVPSNVSVAQFQLWGAGSGNSSGMCCGGAAFGSTGAYATAIVKVSPGQQFTLCAGCACCCFACTICSQCNAAGGCSSFVIGPGLSNFCAEGAAPSYMACAMADKHRPFGITCCRWQNPACTSSGSCICGNGSYYCFGGSCATCGLIPLSGSCRTFFGVASSGVIMGIPGLHSGGCYDTNHYGYLISAPVISPSHTVQSGSCCCMTFDTGSCCGGCNMRAAAGFFCYPGAGAAATHMMAGATNHLGDVGRAGMVRVTYC